MIDESNREEVLEKLDSVVWSYKIQILSLNSLIEIAKNIDKIQIIKDNTESPSASEEKSEMELDEEEIQKILEKSKVQKLSYGEMVKIWMWYARTKNTEDREKILERFPELKKQIEHYNEIMLETSHKIAPTLRHIAETIQRMAEGIFRVVKPIISKIGETKQKVLLRSLLIYSISIWESFLREYLRVILFYNWEVLSSVKKEYKIPYGELLERLHECDEIEDFCLELIDYYLYKLFYKSIDEISVDIGKLNLIVLSEFSEWTNLREAYYRRNIITHNNGVINKTYCKKVGRDESDIGKEIDITPEYLQNLSILLDKFIDYIHEKICEKYKLDEAC